MVKEPTFEFTVAKVPAAVTFPEPSNDGDVHARSPVIARVRPVASAVAVPASPVILAFIQVVEIADHTPAFIAASPVSA